MNSSNDTKDFFRTLAVNPRRDEIVHAERVNVPQIDCCKGLGCFVAMAIGQVAINRDVDEANGKVLQAVKDDWANPWV
jgi:predicted methyltransferase